MRTLWPAAALTVVMLAPASLTAEPRSRAVERMTRDAAAGRALIAHLFLALCDNDNQGIVPVSRDLGNGQRPSSNLYWGARYGVRTYLTRDAGWTPVEVHGPWPVGVLDRVVLKTTVSARTGPIPLVMVADAWDGSRIRETIQAFLEAASGRGRETLRVGADDVTAGGGAHLVVFLGHNGLMDFEASPFPSGAAEPARAGAVIACASKPYFEPLLRRSGAEAVLLTTGLMAPEAYTLDAAVREWFRSGEAAQTRRAAARAYDAFQHCGRVASQRLFDVTP